MSDHGDFREEFHGDHPHSYDHTEPKYSLLFVIGGATVVMLVVVTIVITFYYNATFERQVEGQYLSQESTDLRNLRTLEQKELTTWGVADPKAGLMRMPLDSAIKAVIADAAAGQPKYPTAPYEVKTAAQLAAMGPDGKPVAAAPGNTQNQGAPTNSNASPQQPVK